MISERELECYERLRVEIMRVAVEDYKAALRKSARMGEKCGQEIALEKFFLSGWGQAMSGDNGKYIIDKCRADSRYVRPARSPGQKLTVEQQRSLCLDFLGGMTNKDMAKKYKVSNRTVQVCIARWV